VRFRDTRKAAIAGSTLSLSSATIEDDARVFDAIRGNRAEPVH
jgi:hypothetical protein